MFECSEQKILISGVVGNLEVAHVCPKQNPHPDNWLIICHPHPLHGGSMQNKVVYTIGQAFNALDMAVVKFNFRGVGKSDGSFDHGKGEREDLIAVAQWVRHTYQPQKLWLAGFSFGSMVALQAHVELSANGLLLVAPPVIRFTDDIKTTTTPTWVVQGGEDEVVPAQAVQDWCAAQIHKPQLLLLDTASHFFHAQLNELKQIIMQNVVV